MLFKLKELSYVEKYRKISVSILFLFGGLLYSNLLFATNFEGALKAFDQKRYQDAADIWEELYKEGDPYAGFNLAYLAYEYHEYIRPVDAVKILELISGEIQRAKHLKALFLFKQNNIGSFDEAVDILFDLYPDYKVFVGHRFSSGLKINDIGPVLYPEKFKQKFLRFSSNPPIQILLPVDIYQEESVGLFVRKKEFKFLGKKTLGYWIGDKQIEKYSFQGSKSAQCIKLARYLKRNIGHLVSVVYAAPHNKLSDEQFSLVVSCAKAGWEDFQNILALLSFQNDRPKSVYWFKQAIVNGSPEAAYLYIVWTRFKLIPMMSREGAIWLNDKVWPISDLSEVGVWAFFLITMLNLDDWAGDRTSEEAINHLAVMARSNKSGSLYATYRLFRRLTDQKRPDHLRLNKFFNLKSWLEENYKLKLPQSGTFLCGYYLKAEHKFLVLPVHVENLCEDVVANEDANTVRKDYAFYLYQRGKYEEAYFWASVASLDSGGPPDSRIKAKELMGVVAEKLTLIQLEKAKLNASKFYKEKK